MGNLRIVCLSDTHNAHDELRIPDGDILIHAGDFTGRGHWTEVESFGKFLAEQTHREKIVVAGNHDFMFERDLEGAQALLGDATYLQDSGVTIAELKFWGSPWQPEYHDWAFNLPRGAEIREKWDLVPEETDVLITHGPPEGVMDQLYSFGAIGCEELAVARKRIQPRLHIFGHVHEGYGTHVDGEILSVNAASCNLWYRPVNPPLVVDWDGKEFLPVKD